eukprot:403343261
MDLQNPDTRAQTQMSKRPFHLRNSVSVAQSPKSSWTPFVLSGNNSPLFDQTRLSVLAADKPKPNFKKVFNFMYEDTRISSGLRHLNILNQKKERASKLRKEIYDKEKNTLRKSKLFQAENKDSFADFMQNNAGDLSLKSLLTVRKPEGYTKFKNSSYKLQNYLRIMHEKKSSLNLSMFSSDTYHISAATIIKLQAFMRGAIARIKEGILLRLKKETIASNLQFITDVLDSKFDRVIRLNIDKIMYIQNFWRMIQIRRKYLQIVKDYSTVKRYSKLQEMIDKKWLQQIFQDFIKYDEQKKKRLERLKQIQERKERLIKLSAPKSPTAKFNPNLNRSIQFSNALDVPNTPNVKKMGIGLSKIGLSMPQTPKTNRITMGQQYVIDSMNNQNKKLVDQIYELTNKILKKRGLNVKKKYIYLLNLSSLYQSPTIIHQQTTLGGIGTQGIHSLLSQKSNNFQPEQIQNQAPQLQHHSTLNSVQIEGSIEKPKKAQTNGAVKVKKIKNKKKEKRQFMQQFKEIFLKESKKLKKDQNASMLDEDATLNLDKLSQNDQQESKEILNDLNEEISPYELSS